MLNNKDQMLCLYEMILGITCMLSLWKIMDGLAIRMAFCLQHVHKTILWLYQTIKPVDRNKTPMSQKSGSLFSVNIFSGIGIPIINIRQWWNCPISIMGINLHLQYPWHSIFGIFYIYIYIMGCWYIFYFLIDSYDIIQKQIKDLK